MVPLDLGTRKANMRFFDNQLELVPTHAITIGFREILNCDRTIIMALDASKQQAIYSTLASDPSCHTPASFLHLAKRPVELLVTATAIGIKRETQHQTCNLQLSNILV